MQKLTQMLYANGAVLFLKDCPVRHFIHPNELYQE